MTTAQTQPAALANSLAPLESSRSTGLTGKIVETYLAQVLRIVLSGLTTILVTRALGPSGRGLYAVAVAIGILGVQLGNMGLHASNAYHVARDRTLLPKLLSNSIAVSAVLGTAIGVVTWLICYLWPAVAPLHGSLLGIALVSIPVALAYLLVQNLLLGLHWIRAYNVLEIANRGIFLLAAMAIIATHRTSPAVFVVSSAAITFLCTLPAIRALNEKRFLIATPSLSLFRTNLGLSAKAYLVCFLGYLLLRLDLFMVQRMSGLEQAGWYSIAATLAEYVALLPNVVASVVFPRLSAMQGVRCKARLALRAAVLTACVMVPTIVIAGSTIQIVIRTMFGTAFLPASSAFLLLMPGIFFLGIQTVLVQLLNSEGYPPAVIVAWICAVIVNIALNIYLIPHYGIAGASLASSICYTLMFVLIAFAVLHMVRSARRQHEAA